MASRAAIVPITVAQGGGARRSSSGSRKLQKAEQTIKRLRQRNKEEREFGNEELASVAGPFLVGMMKAKGTELPSIGGMDPELVWGLALGMFGRRIASGDIGQYLQGAGVGLLACAARRAGEVGHMRSNAPAQGQVQSKGYDDDE
jgi:hypothetical protein